MKHRCRLDLSVPFIALVTCMSTAYGENGIPIGTPITSGNLSTADMNSAEPFSNPLPIPDTSQVRAEPASPQYRPGVKSPSNAGGAARSSRAFGSFDIPYTSTRVQTWPLKNVSGLARNYLSTTYPYSTIGKLTFNTPSGSSVCSASVILRSVIVTAAHCVQDFGNPTFFSGWKFQPGHYGATGSTAAQKAPFGTWTTRLVARSPTWADGTDIGVDSARENDVAVFIIAKKGNSFIGDKTGWLTYGWNNYSFVSSPKTGNLPVAATSTLGYPALLDAGNIMQRADGPTYTTTVGGAPQLWQGNNFTGGASGGPWIVNFVSFNPVLSGGAVPGFSAPIAVIGVTSWGSPNPNAPKDNYSSQFGQNSVFPDADYGGYGGGNIGALVNAACNAIAGAGQTYAQLGFCDW